MTNRLKFVLLLLMLTAVVCTQSFAAVIIKDNSVAATPTSLGIKVVWMTVSETNVSSFEVWRAAIISGNIQEFTRVTSVDPHGSGIEYEWTDTAPFKTSSNFFAYKVRVVFFDGSISESVIVKSSPLSSTAKRTWGSIKAMFR